MNKSMTAYTTQKRPSMFANNKTLNECCNEKWFQVGIMGFYVFFSLSSFSRPYFVNLIQENVKQDWE